MQLDRTLFESDLLRVGNFHCPARYPYFLLAAGLLPLTIAGKWGIALVADIVGLFAIVQFVGLRRVQLHISTK